MKIFNKKNSLWALFYQHEGFEIDGDKLMGRQAAGNSYLRALVQSKPETLGLYLKNNNQKKLAKETISSFLEVDQDIKIQSIAYTNPYESQNFGGLFLPGPSLSEFSLGRGIFGHNTYSLIGITHTTASHGVMSSINSFFTTPVMPWDAVICTSQVVADTIKNVTDEKFNQLKFYLDAKKSELPMFPIIPLGTHPEDFSYTDKFKIDSRKGLGINEDDIVIVYVGRLSFHAKAHHLPMYISLEAASKKLKKGKIHLIQTGWFANESIETSFKEEAKLVCPSVKFHFLDGKNQDNKHLTLASGDIFMSLSDNFQETFGLTPLEGMAAGLPVIVSDWNGYRSTVRDGVDGFRIPSCSLPIGSGEQIAYDHMVGLISYDEYIGYLSQKVSIDIDSCISKLNLLIDNKDLRLKLGTNGIKSANTKFSWSNIIAQYKDLGNELDNLRVSNASLKKLPTFSLPADRLDPFSIFESYPTFSLNENTLVTKNKLSHKLSIETIMGFKSVSFALRSLPPIKLFNQVYSIIEEGKVCSLKEICDLTELSDDIINPIIIWLLKYSFLSLAGENNE